MERRSFICNDSRALSYLAWLPAKDQKTVAVLHILHGMAEHAERYDSFAKYLNSHNIAVFAQDHRGHGQSIENDLKGFFADKNGWNRVVEDAIELSDYISGLYTGVPLFLMGHSMGSFMARCVMVKRAELYDGVIIMGTGAAQGVVGKAGQVIANMQIKKNGPHMPSLSMNKLAFGSYNKKFRPALTGFEWLSRDTKQVRKYINDPLCGFVCTAEFFKDLLTGIEEANNKANAKLLPKALPLLIISGSDDPVGNFSKGVKTVYKLYLNAGLKNVQLKLIEGGRHEILNETNKTEVYKVLLDWLNSLID